jgi:signal transduction histidine kinase
MRGLAPDLPAFTVQVRLRDGALATFDSSVEPPAAASPLRLVLALALLLVAVVVLSLIAVRWVTGPLSTLAGAAEALGQDLNRAPLPETGPLEVRRAATAFNGMQQRLSRMISERTRTLAAISHDLKTPITRMRLRTELLEDPALRDKFEHDLGEMEQMVTQALEFMRDASEREPVQRIDVMALLESLQADIHDAHKDVAIEGSVTSPIPARPLALRRCLSNLVENALRYGGSARIRAEEDAAGISLRVIDRGPGIPAEDLEKVFEPFYRGEASRSRETGGYGLGLAIARNIARAHGGDLTLANRAEGGLEAILRLPKS